MSVDESEAASLGGGTVDDVVKPYYGTRTLLELSVGRGSSSRRNHDRDRRNRTSVRSVDVIVYLRRADLEWWNSDVSYHQRQLFRIIGREVLPNVKECADVVQAGRRHGEGGSKVVIGEKNRTVDQPMATTKGAKKAGKGRKKGGAAAARKKRGRAAAAKIDEKDAGTKEAEVGGGKKKKKGDDADVKFLFGETIQIAYRTEAVNTSESATLLFDPDDNDPAKVDDDVERKAKRGRGKQGAKFVTFTQARKLPKRVVLWAYRFDPENPTDPVPDEGGGFPRPEMVPISSLFRQPA